MNDFKPPRLPWSASKAERLEIESASAAMVGARIARVHYCTIESDGSPEPTHIEGFDQVDLGVELLMEDGRAFSGAWVLQGFTPDDWKIYGDNQGLSFGEGAFELRSPVHDTKYFDVTESECWDSRVARRVESVETLWSAQEDETYEGVWAVRINFEGAEPIALALGWISEQGEIDYHPKGIVVIFDSLVASQYRPRAAHTSASGSELSI
jgi:hypothetical protein